MCFKKKFS